MPRRNNLDANQVAILKSEFGVQTMKSRSGRVVKPKVWDDGTIAAPVAAMKGDNHDGIEREGDPDYSDDPVEEHLSEQVQEPEYELDSDDDRYSDGPMGSYGSHGSRGRYGASRDESGKFTQGRSRSSRGRTNRGSGASTAGTMGGGGGIFKMAAVEVLRQEMRLLSTGEIARLALKRGLIKCSGKTPEATMASALYTDIKRREGHSIFIRPHEGLFGLREWIEQGVPFQDDYAEELAKRARANFGYMGNFGTMMPPVVDKDGKPLSTLPYAYPYGGSLPSTTQGPEAAPPPNLLPPVQGLPPLPGYSAGGKAKGRGKPAPLPAAPCSEDECTDEGLMQLLNAAEELHRTSSKHGDQERAKTEEEEEEEEGGGASPGGNGGAVDKPFGSVLGKRGRGAAHPLAEGSAEEALGQGRRSRWRSAPQVEEDQEEGEMGGAAADREVSVGHSQEHPETHASQHGRTSSPADAAAAATATALAAAAAAAAAVMSAPSSRAAAPPSAAVSEGDSQGALRDQQELQAEARVAGNEEASGAALKLPGGETEDEDAPMSGAAAVLTGLMHGSYGMATGEAPPSTQPRLCPPPLQGEGGKGPLQEEGCEDEGEERDAGAALDLVVLGTAQPAQAQRAQHARDSLAGGQEQVNILNLPLPGLEEDPGLKAAPPAPVVTAQHLRQAEALVMKLEGEMGTSHPEVGKALLTLAKLYMAEGGPNSRHLATAAISRAQDVMTVCQVALNRHTSCGSAFEYLRGKAQSAPCGPRALDITVAAGDAALLGLASPPPQ